MKQCLWCKKEFKKDPEISWKQFIEITKYCSYSCYTAKRIENKIPQKEYMKLWRQKNPEKIKKYSERDKILAQTPRRKRMLSLNTRRYRENKRKYIIQSLGNKCFKCNLFRESMGIKMDSCCRVMLEQFLQ